MALTGLESVDAIAQAECELLACMSDALYEAVDGPTDETPVVDTFFYNIWILYQSIGAGADAITFEEITKILKDYLCAYACKELSIAEIMNALACKLGLEKGVFEGESEEKCACCNVD